MHTLTLQDEASRRIRSYLAQGFSSHEQIIEDVSEQLSDKNERQEVDKTVRSVLPRLLAERERDIATWPTVTDCDRLDAAFEDLNARGIMARHHWWCCSNCGRASMPDEFERLDGNWQGVPIIGYTFYHEQDTEDAVACRGIHLSFASCEGGDDEQAYEDRSVAIARTVVDVLKAHGLTVSWDGASDHRPSVSLNWQRRSRPARFCEGDK